MVRVFFKSLGKLGVNTHYDPLSFGEGDSIRWTTPRTTMPWGAEAGYPNTGYLQYITRTTA